MTEQGGGIVPNGTCPSCAARKCACRKRPASPRGVAFVVRRSQPRAVFDATLAGQQQSDNRRCGGLSGTCATIGQNPRRCSRVVWLWLAIATVVRAVHGYGTLLNFVWDAPVGGPGPIAHNGVSLRDATGRLFGWPVSGGETSLRVALCNTHFDSVPSRGQTWAIFVCFNGCLLETDFVLTRSIFNRVAMPAFPHANRDSPHQPS